MNTFAFRSIRNERLYHAEFRLAHWGGFKLVTNDAGEPLAFAHPYDAQLCAANHLVASLNGNMAWWSGPTGNEAKEAAEKLFRGTRDRNGKGETQDGKAAGDCRRKGPSEGA